MTTIALSERAEEWLGSAEPDVRDRVLSKPREAAEFPDHYLTRLRGSQYYKLRIGDYRAIIDWDREAAELLVRRVGKRDGFYK